MPTDSKVESGSMTTTSPSKSITNPNLEKVNALILSQNYKLFKNDHLHISYEHTTRGRHINLDISISDTYNGIGSWFTSKPDILITLKVPLKKPTKYYTTTFNDYDKVYGYMDNYFNETVDIIDEDEKDEYKQHMNNNVFPELLEKFQEDSDIESDFDETEYAEIDPLEVYYDTNPNSAVRIIHFIAIPYMYILLFAQVGNTFARLITGIYMYIYYVGNVSMIPSFFYLTTCYTVSNSLRTHNVSLSTLYFYGYLIALVNYTVAGGFIGKHVAFMNDTIYSIVWAPFICSEPFRQSIQGTRYLMDPELRDFLEHYEKKCDIKKMAYTMDDNNKDEGILECELNCDDWLETRNYEKDKSD